MKELLDIDRVIVHCTASDRSEDHTIQAIRELHVAPKTRMVIWDGQMVEGRGFSAVGYHKIITPDGKIWTGRGDNLQGAHCFGQNSHSLGVALCGDKRFTLAQFRSLLWLLDVWKAKHGLTDSNIYGHYVFSNKNCPNFLVNL